MFAYYISKTTIHNFEKYISSGKFYYIRPSLKYKNVTDTTFRGLKNTVEKIKEEIKQNISQSHLLRGTCYLS
jgi:hypothetical protein